MRPPNFFLKTPAFFFLSLILLLQIGQSPNAWSRSSKSKKSFQNSNSENKSEPVKKPAQAPWDRIENLISEQKNQLALVETEKILASSRQKNDFRNWTEALIRAVQLKISLAGFETAVRFLNTETWPPATALAPSATSPSRTLLHLYYALTLNTYYQSYSWEIRQRERIISKDPLDLKTWTAEQIAFEIRQAYEQALAEAPSPDQSLPEYFKFHLQAGTFPEIIKPSLRDLIVDLAVQHFEDQAFWSPRQTHELSLLAWRELAKTENKKRFKATDLEKHPIEIAATWLTSSFAFHQSQNEPQAALEAQYSLLEMLYKSAPEKEDRQIIQAQLLHWQSLSRQNPWWSRGQALLAQLTQQDETPDRMIRSLKLAQE